MYTLLQDSKPFQALKWLMNNVSKIEISANVLTGAQVAIHFPDGVEMHSGRIRSFQDFTNEVQSFQNRRYENMRQGAIANASESSEEYEDLFNTGLEA